MLVMIPIYSNNTPLIDGGFEKMRINLLGDKLETNNKEESIKTPIISNRGLNWDDYDLGNGKHKLVNYAGSVNILTDKGFEPFEEVYSLTSDKGKLILTSPSNQNCHVYIESDDKEGNKINDFEINITKHRGGYYFTTKAEKEVKSMAYVFDCPDSNISYKNDKVLLDEVQFDFKEAKEKQNITAEFDKKEKRLNFKPVEGTNADLRFIDPSVGLTSPTATGDDYNQWTNPTNAYSSDNSDTYTENINSYQDYYNFGFPSLTGYVTDGINVSVEGSYYDTSATVEVELSWDGGTSYTNENKQQTFTSTSDVIKYYGGSSDTWGRTWSASDFTNTNFRLRVQSIDGNIPAIDHIQMDIYYHLGDNNPTIILNEPSTSTDFTSGQTVLFNCTATDDIALDNITFYWNLSGSFISNGTNSSPINNSKTSFSRTINTYGDFVWNCYVCDNGSNCLFNETNNTFSYHSYSLDIIAPITSIPASVSGGDNVSINFTFQKDGVNLTSGVTMENVTVGGVNTTIHNKQGCTGTLNCSKYTEEANCNNCSQCNWTGTSGGQYAIFFDGFESGEGWYYDISSSCSNADSCNGYGINGWTNCNDRFNDYVWCSSSDTSQPNAPYSGFYGLIVGDWDAGAATNTDGLWYNFNATDACDGGVCDYITVSLAYGQVGLDTSEYCWLTEQVNSGTPSTLLTIDNALTYDTYYLGAFNLSESALASSNVNVRIMCDMSGLTDMAKFDNFNITGYKIDSGSCEAIGSCSSCDIDQCDTNCSTGGCQVETTAAIGYTGSWWQINATVPSGLTGLQDLFLNATYDSITRSETETKAISYQATPNTLGINFTYPTPSNNSEITVDNALINVSIEESDLSEFTFNWNGTNYSIYDKNLVLMLNMNNYSSLGENNTYIKDLSEYSNYGNCTSTNCPTFVSGKYGKGLEFDGINDYVNIDHNSRFNSTSTGITIAAWFKTDKTDCISCDMVTKVIVDGWDIYLGAESKIAVDLNYYYQISYNTSLSNAYYDGEWHHVAVTFNGSNFWRLYYDGIERGGLINTSADTNEPIVLGAFGKGGGGESWFNGSLDEVRLYNTSLDNNSIWQLYSSNLEKLNSSYWYFKVNETDLADGTYTYFASATDTSDYTNTTETRVLRVNTTSNSCQCSSIQAGTTIDCSDNCEIGTCNANGQDILFQGTGTIIITGDITNYGTVDIIGTDSDNKCIVKCIVGCFK